MLTTHINLCSFFRIFVKVTVSKTYYKFLSIIMLCFFLCGNTDTNFFQSEVLEEEEERVEETVDSEIERFFANKGDDGHNYVPEFDTPAIIPQEFNFTFRQEIIRTETLVKTLEAQAHYPQFYILYHNLKLDC
jgi:hypothetical protein